MSSAPEVLQKLLFTSTELLTAHDVKVSEEDDFLSRSAPQFITLSLRA